MDHSDDIHALAGHHPHRRGTALCLSGGGYRAAIFHLGAMLRLHATGRLQRVEAISAVSGGSIAAAWLATRYVRNRREGEAFADWCARIDFLAEVVEPFRRVASRDRRSWPVLATLAWNWLWPSTRVRMLTASYRGAFEGVELRDLPATPRFVFCATDLTFGANWEFSRRRCGDFQAGYLRRHGKIALATAVAASSCFPPLFGPLRLDRGAADFLRGAHRSPEADALRNRIELTDGGVYDNLATEPVLKSAAEVLVSDAGAPFAFVAGGNALRRLLRYAGVVGNQAVALRKRLLFRAIAAGEHAGAYWHLGERRDAGADGYSLGLCARIARIRTDLDRFTAAEFEVLVNHGYFSCAEGLARAGREAAAPAPWPYPGWADESAVRAALRGSERRLLHRRWWQN
jgi:NTE family protein